MDLYEDILEMPRYMLRQHTPMSMQSRAAQFAPFAALTGFDEEIGEAARLTGDRHDLTEDALQKLNAALVWLSEHEPERPEIRVTYFQADALKAGGAYVTYTGRMRFLDEAEGKLKFTDGTAIPFRDLTGIHILHRKDESQ